MALTGPDVRQLHDRFNLALFRRTVIREMPNLRVREPGRHLPRCYCGLDRLRPGTRVPITNQRHRGDLPRPMTGLTVFLENRKYVFGKSGWRGLTGCSSGHCDHRQSSKSEAHHNLASLARISILAPVNYTSPDGGLVAGGSFCTPQSPSIVLDALR